MTSRMRQIGNQGSFLACAVMAEKFLFVDIVVDFSCDFDAKFLDGAGSDFFGDIEHSNIASMSTAFVLHGFDNGFFRFGEIG